MFFDHQTAAKVYFKIQTNQSITSALNYGNRAVTYGLWDGVGVNNAYSYQLLICDTSFYRSVIPRSGYTRNCYKRCVHWCGDRASPYFRTASTSSSYRGVAFNTNGHRPVNNRHLRANLLTYSVESKLFYLEIFYSFATFLTSLTWEKSFSNLFYSSRRFHIDFN